MADVIIYSEGPCKCSVCTPKDTPIEEIEAEVNKQIPTGISSQWKVSKDATFKDGEPNPCPCDTTQGRIHYLLDC